MKNILVLCTGNSCRSQIAEGYLRHFSQNRISVYSAGIEVHGVNSRAKAIMQEDGVDISAQTSNHVNEYAGTAFDVVITVCDNASESCPLFTGNVKKIHRNFPDPAKVTGTEEEIMDSFRAVRNQIKEFCENFVIENVL